MASKIAQRARKPNYTKEETEMLLDQLILYGHFLFNKTQLVNNQQKADVWANIAMQVNSVPNSAGRTVDELKHRWQDMAQRARAVLRKTQSGSPINDNNKVFPLRPVPFLDKILQVLGECQKDSNKRLEDSALTSHDSTYSSDSSCAANETKLGLKEEVPVDQDVVVDLSQSNGSKPPNSLKRALCDSLDLTSKLADTPVESSLDTTNYQKVSSSSSLPLSGLDQQKPSSKLSSVYFSNGSQSQPVEPSSSSSSSKRRKTRDSSSPCNPVMLDQNNIISHLLNGQRGRHHHPTEALSSRSMVLDPESQVVMEVEDFAGDGRSASTSRSASNLSIHDEDHEYDHRNHHHTNNANGVETKASASLLHNSLQASSNPPGFTVHPFISAANNPNLRSILAGNRPLTGQPGVGAMSSSFIPPLYAAAAAAAASSGQHQLPQFFGHIPSPASSAQGHAHSQLESLPKAELERQCLLSQIRMQDTQARYFQLKGAKLQLEIDLLKEKCCCPRNNPSAPASFSSTPTAPTSFSTSVKNKDSKDRFYQNSRSHSHSPSNHQLSGLEAEQTDDSLCHLSISEVTSLESLGFKMEHPEEQNNLSSKTRDRDENEPELHTPRLLDLMSQDGSPLQCKENGVNSITYQQKCDMQDVKEKDAQNECENEIEESNGVEEAEADYKQEEKKEIESQEEKQTEEGSAKSPLESKPGEDVIGISPETSTKL